MIIMDRFARRDISQHWYRMESAWSQDAMADSFMKVGSPGGRWRPRTSGSIIGIREYIDKYVHTARTISHRMSLI